MNSGPTTAFVYTIVIALAFVGVSGCTELQPRPDGLPPSGQYAFLDHHTYFSGTLVSGKCPVPAINVSAYALDTGSGVLAGVIPFEVNSSLLVVTGESVTLSGDYGGGGYGTLSGAYALPSHSGNLTVNGFTRDGTMYLTYQNQSIALEPGTRWMDVSTGTEITTACTINRTVTDIITYYGNYPQSGMTKTRIL